MHLDLLLVMADKLADQCIESDQSHSGVPVCHSCRTEFQLFLRLPLPTFLKVKFLQNSQGYGGYMEFFLLL
jgi:hypothetical protein